MIEEIKRRLLNNPETIVKVLEIFRFSNVVLKSNRITCALDETHDNTRAISIKLSDNDDLFITDFVRNITKDIFGFIMISKDVNFKTVINTIKAELGIKGFYDIENKTEVFGGFYKRIKKRQLQKEQPVYDESILDDYISIITKKFVQDHISPQTHRDCRIMYDVASQRIVFPVYDLIGNIIGIKGRANWQVEDSDPKYLYLVRCNISDTLYGYWQNYSYLQNNIVLITESEKAFFQAYSYGFRNVVSLGSGNITHSQCKAIMSLNPTRVIFCFDESYDIETIYKHIGMLKSVNRFHRVLIDYWHYKDSLYVPEGSKACITDYGKETFYDILRDELEVDISEGLLETTRTKDAL